MTGPHYSPDGRWWWDGQQWRPVQQQQPPGPPRLKPSRWPWFVGGGSLALLLVAFTVCVAAYRHSSRSVVQVNTRYYATERQAGQTIHLHLGDEVTLNLPMDGGRDWNASSDDVHVARPTTTEVMFFPDGRARFIDFALVGTGHARLLACPAGGGPCYPSSRDALTFDVDVT